MKDLNEFLIKRDKNNYEVVIGLEVHAQVTSNSKLFSSSSTKFGAEPNTQVSLVDAAFPGMLPVINEFCVKQAIKTGIGLKAQINKKSVFDRKNYFYADLPQGYQISQYKHPIVGEGKVILDMPNGQKEIGIESVHLEEDGGRCIRDIGANIFNNSISGDCNGDSAQNVIDIVYNMNNCILDVILSNCECADLNNDIEINILDIVILVNIILEN